MKSRRKTLSYTILTWAVLFSVTVSCVEQGDDEPEDDSTTTSDTGSTTTTTTTTTTAASLNKGLYVKIDRAWYDDTATFESVDTCSVALGAATGTTTNCTVSVDEGTLYFSSLKLTIGSADTTTCPIMIYKPMFYGREYGSTTPCEEYEFEDPVTPAPVPPTYNCYNGPATKVPEFPDKRSYTFLTISSRESEFTIDSAFSLDQPTNRWTASNITDPTAFQAGYVPNSLQGYEVECRDYFFDLQYQINLTIQDNDGTSDHFSNWL